MRTHRSVKLAIAIALAAALVAGSAESAPLSTGATQFKTAGAANLEQVRSRGHGGGYGGPYYYGPAYPPPPYYYGPGPYGPPDMDAYCFSRYRSYDPYSGTYMGYDGVRRPCR